MTVSAENIYQLAVNAKIYHDVRSYKITVCPDCWDNMNFDLKKLNLCAGLDTLNFVFCMSQIDLDTIILVYCLNSLGFDSQCPWYVILPQLLRHKFDYGMRQNKHTLTLNLTLVISLTLTLTLALTFVTSLGNFETILLGN